MKRLFASVLAVLAFAALQSSPTAAAPAAQTTTTNPQIEKHGDWMMRCFPVKSLSPCDVFFAAVVKRTGQRIYSVSMAYIPSENRNKMQIAVPFGISLPAGLVLKTNAFTSSKLPFRRCDASGCFVEMYLTSEFVDALDHADGTEASLNVATTTGRVVPLKLSLKGFADAHDAMVANAKTKAQAQ